jgi:hypothetical protein
MDGGVEDVGLGLRPRDYWESTAFEEILESF